VKAWHLRHSRTIIYLAAIVAGLAIIATSLVEDSPTQRWVTARQLFGLWALALLLASLIIGPLTSIFPWIPLKVHLMYGRRAVGVSTFAFAVTHVLCYIIPVTIRSWHEFFAGPLWLVGLALGAISFADLAFLALTSRDEAVKRMGGRRWKWWHRTVYWVLPLVLLHALFNGADFGLNRAPDVRGSPDAGALIGFSITAVAWLVLLSLRKFRWRWIPNRT
jgi:sulfoxide reductase heme-binding subunit YedZ